MISPTPSLPPQPGQMLARGVARALLGFDFVSLPEFIPAPGLRVDLMCMGSKAEIWIVECKSCRADFQTDRKWQGYLPWCDRFFWAVDADFPTDLLPDQTGVILADGFGAEVLRMGPETLLPAARRKVLVRDFARAAARRLHSLRDPGLSAISSA